MNTDFFDYLKNAREKFLSHVEIMKPSLHSKDRVEIEDFVIAYDQVVQHFKDLSGWQEYQQNAQAEFENEMQQRIEQSYQYDQAGNCDGFSR